MAITQDGWFNHTYVQALSNDIALDLSNTSPGVYKGALFQDALTPNFSQSNPAYGSAPFDEDESVGPGYTTAGQDLTVVSFGELAVANKIGWKFEPVSWAETTIEAAGLLIYAPSLSDLAVLLRAFGQTYQTADGNFELTFHADGVWRNVLRTTA